SYTARLRLREFGIRMALGAAPKHLRRLVLRHALRLALWGSAAGLLLAWPARRALRGFLYGGTPAAAITPAGGPPVLLAAALASSLARSRKAAAVDPAVTLRAE